ncbi:hypothetical protein ACI3PL_27735, partial [Lacticaseibacillus paracasei]
VTHLWYLRNTPSPLSVILDVPQKELESVVYFTKFLTTSVNNDKRKEAVANIQANYKGMLDTIDNNTTKIINTRTTQNETDKAS